MTTSNRADAQQRTDEIRIFNLEIQRLEGEGVLKLDAAQHCAVDAYHGALLAQYAKAFDIDRDSQAKQLSLGMRVASFLGALALAASVFFLFYRFWGWFSPMVQVGILVAAALATFIGAAWIQDRDSSGYFTKLAAMVAFACFVLNVIMLGQIFNITPSDKALLPWAAFAFLLAYAFDLRLLLAAGIFCLIAYVAARVGAWSGMYWIHFGERPENFFPWRSCFSLCRNGLTINGSRALGRYTECWRCWRCFCQCWCCRIGVRSAICLSKKKSLKAFIRRLDLRAPLWLSGTARVCIGMKS